MNSEQQPKVRGTVNNELPSQARSKFLSAQDDTERFRKKMAYANGIRKVKLLAQRANQILDADLPQALKHAQEAVSLGRTLITRMADNAPQLNKYRKALGAALQALGLCHLRDLGNQSAEPLLLESVKLFKDCEAWEDMLSSLYTLADANLLARQTADALERINYALDICATLNNPPIQGMFYSKKGLALCHDKQLEAATEAVQSSLERINDYQANDQAHLLATASYVYQTAGKYDQAINTITRAINIIRPFEEQHYALFVYRSNYSRLLMAMGRRREAIRESRECLNLAILGSNRQLEVWALKSLGQLHAELGELFDAIRYYSATLKIVDESGDISNFLVVQALLGQLYYYIYDEDSARTNLRGVVEHLADRDLGRQNHVTWHNRAIAQDILLKLTPELCDLQALINFYEPIVAKSEGIESTAVMAHLLILGRAYELINKTDIASGFYRRIANRSSETGDLKFNAQANLGLARLAVNNWDHKTAYNCLKNAEASTNRDSIWETDREICSLMVKTCERMEKIAEAVQYQRRLRTLETSIISANPDKQLGEMMVNTTAAGLEQQCLELNTQHLSLQTELDKIKQTQKVLQTNHTQAQQALSRINSLLRVHSGKQKQNTQKAFSDINSLIDNVIHDTTSEQEFSVLGLEDQQFIHSLTTNYPSLSATERKVCNFIRQSISNKLMAERMGVSLRAVETYRYRIRHKLGLDRTTDLVQFIKQISGSTSGGN